MLPLVKVLTNLACAAAVIGVRLPGGCPQVPATHILPYLLKINQEIILGIPFSNPNNSYIFRDINSTNARAFNLQLLHNHYVLTISLEVKNKVKYPYSSTCSISHEDLTVYNESIQLNCLVDLSSQYTISAKEALTDCHPPLNITVRTWVDGDFLLIWSCEENLSIDHDEALMVVATHENRLDSHHKNVNGYLEMMKILNKTARKYLKAPLLEKIPWTQEPDFSQSPIDVDPFPCSNNVLLTYSSHGIVIIHVSNNEIIIWSAIALTIAVFVVVMIWCAKKED